MPGGEAREVWYDLSTGKFRGLEWDPATGADSRGDQAGTVVFLHGLSGVADVWSDTIAALGGDRPRCLAIDQRGHGHSPQPAHGYAVQDHLGDLLELVEQLAAPVRLIGHSMGARVAMVAAARHPERFTSVVIVDIGPEAWKANITRSSGWFSALPDGFRDRDEALAFGGGRTGRGGRREREANRFVDWRLREQPDGTYAWLASRTALIETVTVQRRRNYWRDWDRLSIPALLVRGGSSGELRAGIAEQMRRRNPDVAYVEIAGKGHNLPLLAPVALAGELHRFWTARTLLHA